MKPRLKSADLTQEDWLAWLHARHGFLELRWVELVEGYETADRRDADLMLLLEKVRKDTNWARPLDYPRYAIAMTCIRGHHAQGMQFPNGEPL